MFESKWKYLQVFFGGCWHTNGGTDGSTVLQFLKVGLVDNYGIFLEHCLVMVLYYKPELNRGELCNAFETKLYRWISLQSPDIWNLEWVNIYGAT